MSLTSAMFVLACVVLPSRQQLNNEPIEFDRLLKYDECRDSDHPTRSATAVRAVGEPSSDTWAVNYVGDMYTIRVCPGRADQQFAWRLQRPSEAAPTFITMRRGGGNATAKSRRSLLAGGFGSDCAASPMTSRRADERCVSLTLRSDYALTPRANGTRVEFMSGSRKCGRAITIRVDACRPCSAPHRPRAAAADFTCGHRCKGNVVCRNAGFDYEWTSVCRADASWSVPCPARCEPGADSWRRMAVVESGAARRATRRDLLPLSVFVLSLCRSFS